MDSADDRQSLAKQLFSAKKCADTSSVSGEKFWADSLGF